MAQFTKKAILDSFVELISERPFDKITVKDIVTRCGVNRNTFTIILRMYMRWLTSFFRWRHKTFEQQCRLRDMAGSLFKGH
ncbi:MAG: TetR/AcrR family transcriptional regulator [Oscillospiraceae bacterium]